MPEIHPHTWTSTLHITPPEVWRVKELKRSIRLAIDVPGVKLDDLSLEFEDGVFTVTTQRFDTKDTRTETYDLGTLYDPETIRAALECGVLTVTAKKLPNFSARKIAVEAK
jgi:HSP20 family molecular chaperone IbpA